MGQDKDRGITHPLVTSAKQTEFREDQINFRKKDGEKQRQNKNTFPQALLSSEAELHSFIPSFSTSSPCPQAV